MPFVVAASPLRADLGVETRIDELAVVDLRHPERVEDTLVAYDGEPVVLLGRERDREELSRIATLAGTRSPHARVRVSTVAGPSLAVREFGRHAARQSDAVAALAALDILRATAWIAAWMPHVRQLAEVPCSVAQHARSLLPGSGFLVEYAPDPHVVSLTKPRAPEAASRRADQRRGRQMIAGQHLVHSSSGLPWLVEDVQRTLGLDHAQEAAPLHDVVDAHGSSRVVEFVTVSPELDAAVAEQLRDARECPACGARHPFAACPWCGMSLTAPSPLDQGVPQ